MRVLVVSGPFLGHVFPMVSLAQAMRDAGHEVVIATAGEALVVAEAGLPVYDIAPDFDMRRIYRDTVPERPPVTAEELARGVVSPEGVAVLNAVSAELAEGIKTVAQRWTPDVMVYEPLTVAAPVIAAHLGIPAILQAVYLWDGEHVIRTFAAGFGPQLRRYGVDALPPPAAVVSMAPPSLVGHRTGWLMRPVSYSGEGTAPDWLTRRADRPRILVSRSTASGFGGDLMSSVVDAARRIDAQVVLVRPDRRVGQTSDLPDNVCSVGWVPLPAVLPACSGIVHPGGAGTTLAALTVGIPQLIAPVLPTDSVYNGHVVAARGAGLLGDPGAITAEDLDRLINDETLRTAAVEVGDEIAGMPEPVALVAPLETVTVGGRG
jgi:UDP:flavonoid glycosyltransferase YjiC (YdhE family)